MRAVVYNGPKDVSVDEVADATIEAPTDAIVKITATNICGSDLHMYEGRTSLEPGKVIGHENLGEVVEVGSGVVSVKVGDRVCLPFNIGCGFCKNCERGLTGFCLTVNAPNAGGAYGYAEMGPYNGGQAEYLRVPFADFNALQLPEEAWRRRTTTSCWPTSSRPGGTGRGWPRFSQATASPSTVQARSG
jgi:threonine dehydrogenase-like Zn-dependent dehydrogenase